MTSKTVRIVDHADDLVRWAVRAIPEGPAMFLAATRQEALAVADRHLLGSPIGGLLQVFAGNGTLEYEVPYNRSGSSFVVQADAAMHREPWGPEVIQEQQSPPIRAEQQANVASALLVPPPEPAETVMPRNTVEEQHRNTGGARIEAYSSSPPSAETPADGRSNKLWPMGWVWPIACVVVLICFYGWSVSDALQSLIESGGSVESHAGAMLIAALYTAPAVVSFFLISLALIRGWLPEANVYGKFFLAGGILLAAGFISNLIALGAGVDLSDGGTMIGPPGISLLIFAITAYINSWGFAALFAAVALGIAAAMSTDNFLRQNL